MKRLGDWLAGVLVLMAVAVMAAPISKIQVRRGPEANLPARLANGEPAFTTDSRRLFFGYSTGREEYLQRARFLGYTAVTAERKVEDEEPGRLRLPPPLPPSSAALPLLL